MAQYMPIASQSKDSYWLTRFILLRLLGLVYAVAFLAAAEQVVPLIGAHGLLPNRIPRHLPVPPLLDGRPFPKRAPPPLVIWLFRWLIFRIMLGSALIKLRGDEVWRDLTG